jgi:hypothetical protein
MKNATPHTSNQAAAGLLTTRAHAMNAHSAANRSTSGSNVDSQQVLVQVLTPG